MTLIWTILIAWLALQLPLGILLGKSIELGMGEPATGDARDRTQRRGDRRTRLVLVR
jgi:hypothetical protein